MSLKSLISEREKEFTNLVFDEFEPYTITKEEEKKVLVFLRKSLAKVYEEGKRETVDKIDKFIQNPPITRGSNCIWFNLDEFNKLKSPQSYQVKERKI